MSRVETPAAAPRCTLGSEDFFLGGDLEGTLSSNKGRAQLRTSYIGGTAQPWMSHEEGGSGREGEKVTGLQWERPSHYLRNLGDTQDTDAGWSLFKGNKLSTLGSEKSGGPTGGHITPTLETIWYVVPLRRSA